MPGTAVYSHLSFQHAVRGHDAAAQVYVRRGVNCYREGVHEKLWVWMAFVEKRSGCCVSEKGSLSDGTLAFISVQ